MDTYEATHDYDEYHFDLDEIEHDPYVLLSILSALHEGVFTLDEVQGDLEMLFDKQYILTETVTTETRYRTETRTDSEGNEYEVEVPYTWYICTVHAGEFRPLPCASLHHGRGPALHVRRVYVPPWATGRTCSRPPGMWANTSRIRLRPGTSPPSI